MNPAPLAKAKAPTRLPGETPLFHPPSHLHAEKRTDKLGRTITRWVNRERPEKAEPVRVLDAPTQPKPKPRRSPPPRRATGAPTPTPPAAPKHDQPDMFKHAPKVDPKARAHAMRHDGPLFDSVRREEQRQKPRPPGAPRPLPNVTEALPGGRPPARITVTADVKTNTAVLQHEGSDVTWRVPRESLRQHLEEMGGRIEARRPPSNPHLRSVMNGTAKLLGRGNDGIVWSTGNKVVKMGGVTPYQRVNHHAYRTPAEARERIQAEHDIGQKMRAAGVTGVPDSEYVEHEGRGYLIRDHLRIPDKLTLPQLRQVERHIASMHAAGFTLNDLPQFGVNRKGEMEHYDLGTATSLDGANEAIAKHRIDGDLDNLGLLFQKHGHEYEPEVGHGLRRHLDYATGVSLFTPKDAPLELREKRARNIAEAYQRFAKVYPKDDEARREAADAIKELDLDPGRYIVDQTSISDRVSGIMAKAIGPNLHKELRVVVRKDGTHTQNYWVGQEQPSLFPDLTAAPAADEPAPPPAPTPDPLTISTPADNDGGGGSDMTRDPRFRVTVTRNFARQLEDVAVDGDISDLRELVPPEHQHRALDFVRNAIMAALRRDVGSGSPDKYGHAYRDRLTTAYARNAVGEHAEPAPAATTPQPPAHQAISPAEAARRAVRRSAPADDASAPAPSGEEVGADLFPADTTPALGVPARAAHAPRTIVYTRIGQRRRITDDDPSLYGERLLGHEGGAGVLVHYRYATPDEERTLEERKARAAAKQTLAPALRAAHSALRSALFAHLGAQNGSYVFANILPVLGRSYTSEVPAVQEALDAFWEARRAYDEAT